MSTFDIMHGDCMSLISLLPNRAFRTIFADPPYFLSNGGISVQSGKMVCVDKGDWDKGGTPEYIHKFNWQWLSLCREKLTDDGTIWVSGTYHNIFAVANCLTELGYKILNVITWQKSDPPPNLSCRYFNFSTEYIVWARKSAKVPHHFNYEVMKQLNGGRQMTDVWKIPAVGVWEKHAGKHPTQKPLRLLYRIILASTDEGDTVLDPFAGSSTTGIAANLLGRNFIGLEQEKEYVEMSLQRRKEIDDPVVAEKMRRKMSENSEEVMVLANHARSELRELMIEKGLCYLRAGETKGTLQVSAGFEKMAYVLLHTAGEQAQLFRLITPGRFAIWTRETLEAQGFHPEHADYYIVLKFNPVAVDYKHLPRLVQKTNTYRARLFPLSDFMGLR